MRLLLVEDDAMVGRAMRHALFDAGFSVDWVTNGNAAEQALSNDAYALALLDLGLPGRDGLTLLRRLRSRKSDLAVIIVTARDALAERVEGLNAGADDYVLKPFEMDELLARVHALLRRRAGSASPILSAGALTLDPIRKTVSLRGAPVEMSAKEIKLLEVMLQKPGAVYSRAALEEALYGWGEEIASNAIEVHLHNLRKKLGAETIRNVRGVGYKIVEVE
jgi:two-component system response regulator QseB